MSDLQSRNQRRNYGNMQTTRRARLLGISLAGIAAIAISAITFMVLLMFQQYGAGFIVLGVGFTLAAVLIISRLAGRTAPERRAIRRSFNQRTKNGDSLTIAGPHSSKGSYRPDGLLAEMTSVPMRTVTGTEYELLWFDSTKTAAVAFDVVSSDKSGISQDSINTLVGNWAGLLVSAAQLYEPGLITVVTESAISDGREIYAAATRQRQRVLEVSMVPTPLDPTGEKLAERREKLSRVSNAVDELTAQISSNTPVVRQRVTLSLVPAAGKTEDGKSDASLEAAADVANAAVDDFVHWLKQVGCRSVEPAKIHSIAEAVRCAFDPSMVSVFDQARAELDPIKLGWNDSGPASAQAYAKHYEHEDFVSATIQMAGPPAHAFNEEAFANLLQADPVAKARRITQFFTPFTAEQSEAISDSYINMTQGESSGGRRVKARQTKEMRIAEQVADEITHFGAVMYRYTMLMTVTADSLENLARAKRNLLRTTKSGIKIGQRNTYRQTDTQFALGLGLGLVPSRVATLSDFVREAL